MPRIQACVRILKDDLDIAMLRAWTFRYLRRKGHTVVDDLPGIGTMKACDRSQRRGLTAARFAHQGNYLATADTNVHVVYDRRAVAITIGADETLDL